MLFVFIFIFSTWSIASRLWDQSIAVLLSCCKLVLLQIHCWWDQCVCCQYPFTITHEVCLFVSVCVICIPAIIFDSHLRPPSSSNNFPGSWIHWQRKPVRQLWSQVCHSNQLYHTSVLLYWYGHCQVSSVTHNPKIHRSELYTSLANSINFGHFGICSISAQSNFAVGAVVNATFGSITELTFYITALLRGHKAAKPCLQEVVKAALTGTLLGCILFIPVSQEIFFKKCTSNYAVNNVQDNLHSVCMFISLQSCFTGNSLGLLVYYHQQLLTSGKALNWQTDNILLYCD